MRFTVDIGSGYGESVSPDGIHTLSQEPPDLQTYSGTISARMLNLSRTRLPRITNFAAKTRECR